MKNRKALLLILPLAFTLGACGSTENSMNIDVNSFINGSSLQVDDFVKDFIYNTSVANAKLNSLASKDGYSFKIRAEHELVPDDNNESRYCNVVFSGLGDVNWATVDIVNKDDEVQQTYYAAYENSADKTYVNAGEGWFEADTASLNLPYTIKEIKDMLVLSGQYLPYLTNEKVKKSRTIEIGRECIKYSYDRGDEGEFTLVVDRQTQLLIHLTNIAYTTTGAEKDVMKITEFLEYAPTMPTYK